jgi:lipopolysaccharide/colanic/teichoic acid biosynthesis glycosyltransferase
MQRNPKTNEESSLFARYAQVGSEADLSWLVRAQRYFDQGFGNEEFLIFLTQLSYWHSIYKSKQKYRICKNMIEVLLCICALPIVLPILLFFAALIKLSSKGPVFYLQLRVGFMGRPFYIIKFRTMFEGAEGKTSFVKNDAKGGIFKSKNDPRITPIGKFLRRWSLDELPQIINIIKGDMALIGPRPIIFEDASTTPPEAYIRYCVKPGLTGLWQTTARGDQNGFIMFDCDTRYVQTQCLSLDLKILFKTVYVVLFGIGSH